MNEQVKAPLLGKGTWLAMGSPVVAELAAACGFDWLLFDMEHGTLTEGGLLHNLQAAKREGVKLIVRVGSIDPVLIARALDWGASGIMVPHVSTSRQAKECVLAIRYPPRGRRGFSSSARSFEFGLSQSEATAVKDPFLVVQLEDYEGVISSESIANVDGVDILFVGPADLKLDLSTRPPQQSLTFEKALDHVLQTAQTCKKQCGILVKSQADFLKFRQMGFENIAVGSDLSFLRTQFLNACSS